MAKSCRHGKSGSLTQRVYADILDQIERGDYDSGAYLPSESNLAEEHEVSRVTVRRALKLLADHGVVASEPGRGWRVMDGRTQPARTSRDVALVYASYPDSEITFQAARRALSANGFTSHWCEGRIDRNWRSIGVDWDRISGIIVGTGVALPKTFLARVAQAGVPVCCIGHEQLEPYDCVASDSLHGFQALTRWLVREGGHRSVACLSARILTQNDPGFVRREAGYRAAMYDNGLEPAIFHLPGNVLRSEEDRASVVDWISRLHAAGRRPSAIMCTAANLANGLLETATDHGWRVPEDIQITGFARGLSENALDQYGIDDFPAIERPKKQLGEAAASLLLSRMSGSQQTAQLVLLAPRLVTCVKTATWSAEKICE